MNFQQQQEQQQQNKMTLDLILQDVCTSFTQKFQMQSINSFQHLSSQYIDQVVEIEMKRVKVNCSEEEANYVEQMLLENPIIVERRTLTPSALNRKATAAACSALTEAKHVVTPHYCYSTVQELGNNNKQETLSQQQQQRSDACRRSRINNKIKKAKIKYRHKFMSNKLLQSANKLECLQKLILQMENQLISKGFNALQLLKLKKKFSIISL